MSDRRISGHPTALAPLVPPRAAGERAGVRMQGDRLALGTRSFSWSRAGGHFWHGLGQQLKQMLIHRVTRRLHNEDVHATDVLEQLKMNLSIGESLQASFAYRDTDELADLLA